MIKRILVVADGSPAGRTAEAAAIEIATRYKAEITGIGVVDRPWITAPQATPLGGSAYKAHRDAVLLEQFRERVAGVLAAFQADCTAAGVPFATIEAEGAPAETIEAEAEAHDLIAVGRETNFHFEPESDTAKAVARLVRDNPRPLLVSPARRKDGDRALLCYDGSLQAARAMHMFVLLGLAADRELHLVSVGRDSDQAAALARRGLRLFESHGIRVEPHGIASDAHPGDILLAEADALTAGYLVMGAFGHSGLRELFLGSVTRTLLHKCETTPLFIHH